MVEGGEWIERFEKTRSLFERCRICMSVYGAFDHWYFNDCFSGK